MRPGRCHGAGNHLARDRGPPNDGPNIPCDRGAPMQTSRFARTWACGPIVLVLVLVLQGGSSAAARASLTIGTLSLSSSSIAAGNSLTAQVSISNLGKRP